MINIIVARCRSGGIGMKNKLPWHLSADLKNFKERTIGNGNNAVIMGRKTWESLPKTCRPLPNRYNIIVSSSIKLAVEMYPNCKVVSDMSEALQCGAANNFDTTWVIGGAGIYDAALSDVEVDEVHITNINNPFPCDTFFPDISDKYNLKEASSWTNENYLSYRFEVHVPVAYDEQHEALTINMV